MSEQCIEQAFDLECLSLLDVDVLEIGRECTSGAALTNGRSQKAYVRFFKISSKVMMSPQG